MYYIGVDLGGTNIAAGVVSEDWKLVVKSSVKTNVDDPDALVKDMADLIKKVISDAGISVSDIKSIGIGSPGTIDSKNGVVVYANNINFHNFPLAEKLKKFIVLPVFMSNDANVAALGEFVAGGAKEYNSAVMVTLGTGVGGGIILDGKIWEGYKSAGAEIGHTVIAVDGEQCSCGRKGCWEAYSSATALIRDTKRAIEKNPSSLMAEIAENDGKVSGKTAFSAAKKGDSVAQEVIDNYIKHLAEGIANILNLIAPEVVLLGGGIAYEGENLLVPLRKKVKSLVYGTDDSMHGEIKSATLGNDAGIIGAAALGK